MRKLRPWQQIHLDKCKKHFRSGSNIFLSQAVTGAGKTTLGVVIAKWLLDEGLIKRIVVLCPSIEIADGWIAKFTDVGIVASRGNIEGPDVVALVVTYASGGNIPSGPVATLVILDEIHHAEREASWGITADTLARHAKYTVALTGTPWMTTGRISILSDNGYYSCTDENGRPCIEADDEYSYRMDLRSVNDEDRATVPVQCHFFASTASRRVDEDDCDGGTRTDTLILEAVTEENKDRIKDAKQTNHNVPLGPHVKIEDDGLTKNKMARDLLRAAASRLDLLRASPTFRKGPKPMGLVTCCTIREARYVANYLETVLGQTAEAIVSKDNNGGDDSKSAKRLRALADGKVTNPPSWIVSVGMVSEGVDIPAIKVIAFLNQITTPLFLIQLLGRALRRIVVGVVKGADGEEVPVYADKSLDGTRAFVFAPAHPIIVKIGADLETVSNQAIDERKKRTPGEEGPDTPKDYPKYDVDSKGHTAFYRGFYIRSEWKRDLSAIEADEVAMAKLGQHWLSMILDWMMRDEPDAVNAEIEKRLKEFDITPEDEPSGPTKSRTYDEDSAWLKRRARDLAQTIRFAHPRFKVYADDVAYGGVRGYVTAKLLGGGWVKFDKLSLEQKSKWVKIAEKILSEECN